MLKKIFLVLSVLLLAGWGRTGHLIINKNAVKYFPTEFNFDWMQQLGDHASDADYRKGSDPTESPKHFIDIDSYQSFVDSDFIIQDYDSIVSVFSLSKVIDIGILPWTIITTTDSLQAAFEREDYNRAVLIAADLGHYVGDAHMPLHITKNYNGQLSGQSGIHSRYESSMIDKYSSQISYIADSVSYVEDISDYVFKMIYNNYDYVDSVLSSDKAAKTFAGNTNSDQYYQKLWELTDNFTTKLFQHASKSLAELIITAWINAGRPNSLTAIDDFLQGVNSFHLYQNYPNPFNPSTKIKYTIPSVETRHTSSVQLIIYDILGHEIATLVNEHEKPGTYEIEIDLAATHSNVPLPSGIYFYQLKVGSYIQTKKMVLLK